MPGPRNVNLAIPPFILNVTNLLEMSTLKPISLKSVTLNTYAPKDFFLAHQSRAFRISSIINSKFRICGVWFSFFWKMEGGSPHSLCLFSMLRNMNGFHSTFDPILFGHFQYSHKGLSAQNLISSVLLVTVSKIFKMLA
jgi:hypothetical protein